MDAHLMLPVAIENLAAAPPGPHLQTVELAVNIPIPEEFGQMVTVPIVAGFPPFCSGQWIAFLRWNDPAGTQDSTAVFGVHYTNVLDSVVPAVGSYLILEDVHGTQLRCGDLVNSRLGTASTRFPRSNSEKGGILSIPLVFTNRRPRSSASQACIRIKLVFETGKTVCVCRAQSTSRFNDLLELQMVNDVRFYFPRIQRELWSSSKVLIKASSYFKSLLDGGFSESGNWISEPTVILDLGVDDRTFDDSDDETDDNLPPSKSAPDASNEETTASSDPPATKKQKTPTSTSSSCSSPSHRFREIIIKSASYTTYRAILAWIESGQITYRAALASSPPVIPATLSTSSATSSATPSVTPPAAPSIPSLRTPPNSPSPKSVYRLTQFLDLPKLAAHSLEAIKSRLTVDNIAAELFGDVSLKYPEVQRIELEFAIENWEQVKDTAGMKEVQRMLEDGEGSVQQGAVAMKLARRQTK